MTANNGYITLAQLKTSLEITDTLSDSQLSSVIETASRSIDGYCGRSFYPERKVNYFDTPCGRDLDMGLYDCLEIVTITNGSEGALATTEYRTFPYNFTPFYEIRLKPQSVSFWATDTDSSEIAAISVDAIWGYRSNYSREAWSSVTTLSSGISDTDTTIITALEYPFSAGDIIKLGTEMMLVTDCDTAGVDVLRGYNGTTAAAHLAAVVCYRFMFEPIITQAALFQAQRYWKRKDAPFGVAGVGTLGQVVSIAPLDPDLQMMLFPVRRIF